MSQTASFKKHPIQLENIKVVILSLKVNFDNQQDNLPDEVCFELFHGHSQFNVDDRKIAVKIGASVDSTDGNDSPFDLRVELLGIFSVSDEFDEKYVESWAKTNAPLIIYPYLREHVYSLTSRAGFEGRVLPLFEIPVFKIES